MQLCINCKHCIPFGDVGLCRKSNRDAFLGTRVNVYDGTLIYTIQEYKFGDGGVKESYTYEVTNPDKTDIFNYCKKVRGTNETCEFYEEKVRLNFFQRILMWVTGDGHVNKY